MYQSKIFWTWPEDYICMEYGTFFVNIGLDRKKAFLFEKPYSEHLLLNIWVNLEANLTSFDSETNINSQVSSMQSTTKLCRFSIDDRRSTVILRWWIGMESRHRPYFPRVNRHRPSIMISTVTDRPVEKLVDRCRYVDRCWDHSSPPMGPWTSWWMGVRDHFSPPLGPWSMVFLWLLQNKKCLDI